MAVDLEPPAQDVVDAASTSAWLQDDRQEPSSPLKGRLDSFAAVDNVDNNDHAQQQPFRLPAHTFHRHVESGAMHATPTPMNARATRQRVVPVAVAQEQRQQDDADDSAAELHNLLDAVDVSEDCDDDHQASHDHSQDRMSRRLAQLSFDDDDADNAPDESFHRQHRHDGSAGPTIELDDEDMERIAAEMDKSGVSSSGGFIIGSSPVRRVASSPVRVTSSPVRQPAEFHDPLGLFGTPQVKSSAASATAAGSPHRQVLLPASSVSSPERREQRVDDNGPHHSSSRAALQRQHAQPPIATSMHSGDERKRQAHASTATRMPATAGAASLSPSVPSEYYGVLAEVRKECQHLRQLNERLMRSNEDARRALGM